MNHTSNCLLLLLASFVCHLFSTVGAHSKIAPDAEVPAVFAFGDAIMDTGNNNQILTMMKATFPPYGRDFEQKKATGRFSNGRILSDFLAEALGVKKQIPAYLDPNLQESDILTGVSFASAAAGFDDLIPKITFVKSMKDEVEMFKVYISKLRNIVGKERARFILNNSVSFVVAGTNDIVNYFDIPFRRVDYDFDSYTDLMITSAYSVIKRLHKLGLRKIAISNIPVVGCTPSQRTLGGGLKRGCAEDNNKLARLFNAKLANKLEHLTARYPSSKLAYVDHYGIMLDLIENATNYGFEVVDRGCCGSGTIELGMLCNPFSSLCKNERQHLFWDSYHPTERAYQIISDRIMEKYVKQLV